MQGSELCNFHNHHNHAVPPFGAPPFVTWIFIIAKQIYPPLHKIRANYTFFRATAASGALESVPAITR